MFRSSRLGVGVAACVLPLATLAAQPQPNSDLELAHHVGRRVAFGPTPALVDRIVHPAVGMTALQEAQAYIAEQLAPNAAADPNWPFGSADVQTLAGPGGTLGVPAGAPPHTTAQINGFSFVQVTGSQLAHGLDSQWQLREAMCQFWERHFNTHLVGSQFWFQNKIPAGSSNEAHAWYYEWRANEYYRANALGTFRDLLEFTSQHVTMIAYLHLDRNTVGGPNEDYARELLELYTMSPEQPVVAGPPIQNYSQQDVEAVARILTGWNIDYANDFTFQFVAGDHDFGPKPPLFPAGLSVPAGVTGVGEGTWLLGELANLDATKDFICRKILDEFLIDGGGDFEPILLGQMKLAWGTDGDIQAVLGVLLNSLQFLGPNYRWERARLPFEAVLAPPRAFGAQIPTCGSSTLTFEGLFNTWMSMTELGQGLQGYPAPNGYPRASAAQHSPHAAMVRFSHAARSLFPNFAPSLVCPGLTTPLSLDHDVAGLVGANLTLTWTDPVAVSAFLLETLYGTQWTVDDQVAVIQSMGNGLIWWATNVGTPTFVSPSAPDYQHVVNCAAITAMSMSQGAIR